MLNKLSTLNIVTTILHLYFIKIKIDQSVAII